MFHFVRIHPQAYICAAHIQGVCTHEATPMFTDAHNCDLIVPTFQIHSSVTLRNGMHFYSSCLPQDLSSAVAEANQQVSNVPMMPLAVSDRITVDPAYIVAVLPYNPQICDCVEERGYAIYPASRDPQCLILMEDDTCLAVEIAPSELVDKLNAQQA